MEKKYIQDKDGVQVLPITHISAVRDDGGNTLDSILANDEQALLDESNRAKGAELTLLNNINAETTRATAAEGNLNSTKANKATTLAGYGVTDAYTKSETYNKTELNNLITTPNQQYITVATYAELPVSGSADTVYRVSNYNGSTNQVDATMYSEYAWNGSDYTFLCVKSQIGEVFDITAYNSNTKYADLAAALGTNGANVPEGVRKGGMSVKYVSNSDNKYVQYRFLLSSFNAAQFTNIDNWQTEFIGLPTDNSNVNSIINELYCWDSNVTANTPINIVIYKAYLTSDNKYINGIGLFNESRTINISAIEQYDTESEALDNLLIKFYSIPLKIYYIADLSKQNTARVVYACQLNGISLTPEGAINYRVDENTNLLDLNNKRVTLFSVSNNADVNFVVKELYSNVSLSGLVNIVFYKQFLNNEGKYVNGVGIYNNDRTINYMLAVFYDTQSEAIANLNSFISKNGISIIIDYARVPVGRTQYSNIEFYDFIYSIEFSPYIHNKLITDYRYAQFSVSNNADVNSVVKELYIPSALQRDSLNIVFYKSYLWDNKYQNGIGIYTDDRTVNFIMVNKYDTEQDALLQENLTIGYTSNGICFLIDLSSLNSSRVAYNNVVFKNSLVGDMKFQPYIYNQINNTTGGKSIIYTRNYNKDVQIRQSCRFGLMSAAKVSGLNSKDFQAVVIGDSHEDNLSLGNAIDAANDFSTVDCLFLAGDISGGIADYNYMNGAFKQYLNRLNKPFYLCVGNHDRAGAGCDVDKSLSMKNCYNLYIKPMVDAGYLEVGEYTEGKCYYYHDFNAFKIRLIVLMDYELYEDSNSFDTEYWEPIPYNSSLGNISSSENYAIGDEGNVAHEDQWSFRCVKAVVADSGNVPKYAVRRDTTVITTEQRQWLADTLYSTPAGYNVVIMQHELTDQRFNAIDNPFTTDYKRSAYSYINGISDIVGAYQNKDNFVGSDSNAGVIKDFSTRADSSFLAFIGGHYHKDLVCKHTIYNHYAVHVTSCKVFNNYDYGQDVARSNEDSISRDSITVMSFATNRLGLVKIGADININGKERKFTVINTNEL